MKKHQFYPWRSGPEWGYRCLWDRAEGDGFQDKHSQLGRAEGWNLAPGSGTLEDRPCTLPALQTPGTSLVKTFQHWWHPQEDIKRATLFFVLRTRRTWFTVVFAFASSFVLVRAGRTGWGHAAALSTVMTHRTDASKHTWSWRGRLGSFQTEETWGKHFISSTCKDKQH